jgi:hypothetical protein
MNRLSLGMAVLVLSVAATSCGDPTGDLRGDVSKLVATPSAVTLDQGATQNVVVRAVDEQGNEVLAPVDGITVNPSNLVTVTIDSTFLAGTDTSGQAQIPDPTKTQLVVTGVERNAGTITVSAGGQTLDIPVRVIPVATEFDATFSNQAPALAEQVTLTPPAGFTFTDSSVVSFAGAPNPLVSVAPDGSSLTFLPAANTVGHATITNVVPAYAPGFRLQFTTVDTIATPIFDSLDATLTTTTPTAGQPVTLTAPAGFRFQPGAAITVAGIAAIVNSRATDSSSVTFQVQPGTVGAVKVDSAVISVLPEFPLSIAVRDTIVAGPVAPLGGTASAGTAPNTTAPDAGGSAAIFDLPDFTATVDHFYKLTVAEAGDYTITTDWSIGSDVDQIICNDAACSAPDFTAATGAKPESGTYTLTPGTYWILVEDFGGDAAGATVTITIDHAIPAGP